MNGIVPPGLYVFARASCPAVGVCSVVYPPVAGSGMFVVISTGVNVRYGLVKVEP